MIIFNEQNLDDSFQSYLDDSFPKSQFLVDGFSEPFRIDTNRSGGGVMIYVQDKKFFIWQPKLLLVSSYANSNLIYE